MKKLHRIKAFAWTTLAIFSLAIVAESAEARGRRCGCRRGGHRGQAAYYQSSGGGCNNGTSCVAF